MRRRHTAVLGLIFGHPPPADLKWREIEGLLLALSAEVTERAGSRVAVDLNGITAVFHRPHPRPELDRGAVRDLREFLTAAGVHP